MQCGAVRGTDKTKGRRDGRREGRRREEGLTVRVPDLADEAHRRRRQRVVFGEAQLGGEDAAFEGGAFGALDERFPDE